MLFRKRKTVETPVAIPPQETTVNSRSAPIHSSAETAHLIGPGCVKLQAEIPIWKPAEGAGLSLHPRYLRRILCYGNVDFSTATLQLFWQRGIQVSFLSQDCRKLLGVLQPTTTHVNLSRLQHLSAADGSFALQMSQSIVQLKLNQTVDSLRYFQRQSIGSGDSSKSMSSILDCLKQIPRMTQLNALRGIEGRAAAVWYSYFATVLPGDWKFAGRKAHPPGDPVNALLSLGYTLATTRCGSLLAGYGLDPRVGFFHQLRAGRDSLACDLVEGLRVPVVDRLVLKMLRRQQLKIDSFESEPPWRLKADSFRLFLKEFEEAFQGVAKEPNFQQQICLQIEQWIAQIRELGQRKKWELSDDKELE